MFRVFLVFLMGLVESRSLGPWQEDGNAPICSHCLDSFSVTKRRHHCRRCGRVFCAECCSCKRVIEELGSPKLQRVCVDCNRMMKSRAATRQQQQAGDRPVTFAAAPSQAASTGGALTAEALSEPSIAAQPGPSPLATPLAEEPEANKTHDEEVPLAAAAAPATPIVQGDEVPRPADSDAPAPNLGTSAPQPVQMAEENGEEEDPGCGTPPSMAALLDHGDGQRACATAPANQGDETVLSLFAVIEDNLLSRASAPQKCRSAPGSSRAQEIAKQCDDVEEVGDKAFGVLLYVCDGKELLLSVPFSSRDAIGDVVHRLAPQYFQLKYGMRRRATAEAVEQLEKKLAFYSQHGQKVPASASALEVSRVQHRLLLAEAFPETRIASSNRSVASDRIFHSFFAMSDHSEPPLGDIVVDDY